MSSVLSSEQSALVYTIPLISYREYQGFHVTVISTLPASAGLGSSAAFSVSLAASFLSLIGEISHNQQRNDPLHQQASEDSNAKSGEIVDRANEVNVGLPKAVLERLDKMGVSGSGYESGWSPQELEVVNEWGLKAEELIHGTPSGIDNSVSTFGKAFTRFPIKPFSSSLRIIHKKYFYTVSYSTYRRCNPVLFRKDHSHREVL